MLMQDESSGSCEVMNYFYETIANEELNSDTPAPNRSDESSGTYQEVDAAYCLMGISDADSKDTRLPSERRRE
jgi:hypothetical protein